MYPGPRILFAAPRSGSGKTTITCAILAAFKEQGVKLSACKCGPDYIDPMFHRRVLGLPSGNLDTFFTDEETTRELLALHTQDTELTVIEGVMGYFDGLGGTSLKGSTYEVASVTKTPVILVVDGKGASVSLAAEIRGFLEFQGGEAGCRSGNHCDSAKDFSREESGIGAGPSVHCLKGGNGICGILLNRVSPGFYPRLKQCLEESCGIPVVGYFPEMKGIGIPSRHLGLVSPEEIADAKKWLETIAVQAEKSVDLPLIMKMAKAAPPMELPALSFTERLPKLSRPVRIAVARDEAFSFFYEENAYVLRQMGAELIPFSPIRDTELPNETDGLILGGGYPELHVKELEAGPLRHEIAKRISEGLPCAAECGGFLYLHEYLQNADGSGGMMAGVLPGGGFPAGGLRRFGYFEAETLRGGLFGDAGTKLKGHEFHHFDTEDAGDGMLLAKPLRDRKEPGVVYSESLAAGFPHFYYASCPDAAFAFLEKCLRYQSERLAKRRWDQIAHPLGGLGELEKMTARLAALRESAEPCDLTKKALAVFCGDHGVVEEGVSQSDCSITRNVADALALGRSVSNVLSRKAGADVFVVDVGMCGTGYPERRIRTGAVIDRRVANGTKNILREPAMTEEDCRKALCVGEEICGTLARDGYRIVAAGEMGIGNTTSTSAITAFLLGMDAELVVGRGAGLRDRAFERKKEVVAQSVERVRRRYLRDDLAAAKLPLIALRELGGFEIAAIAGFFLGGAKNRIPVVADGVISLAAAYIAQLIDPRVKDILFVSHRPYEPAGARLLHALGQSPILDGGFHVGEGSGALMLLPLMDMALAVYKDTPSFSEREMEAYVPLGVNAQTCEP